MSGAKEKPHVLVVDDSEINRELLEIILQDEYHVVEAEDGADAVEILKKQANTIDAVLLDLIMPHMDGYQVLEWMRSENYLERIPVIIISTENDPERIKKAYECGATDYFKRPFDCTTVKKRLGGALHLHRQYESIIEMTEQMLFVCDRENFRVFYASNSFCDRFQVSKELVYEQDICECVLKHCPSKEEQETFYRIMQGAEDPVYCDQEGSYFQLESKEIKWGTKDAYVVVVTDVSNLIRLSEERKTSLKNTTDSYLVSDDKVAAVVCVNLTQDVCAEARCNYKGFKRLMECASAQELITVTGEHIFREERRRRFEEKFEKDKLLETFQSGSDHVSDIFPCEMEDGIRFEIKVTVAMYRNALTNDVEAYFYISDYTDDLLKQKILEILYHEKYKVVGVIDLKQDSYMILKGGGFKESDYKIPEQRYHGMKKHLHRIADKYFPKDQQDHFLQEFSVFNMKKCLEKEDAVYVMVSPVIGREIRILKVRYQWIQEDEQILLFTIEDKTKEVEKDNVTEGLNLTGFCNKADVLLQHCKDPKKYAIVYINLKSFKAVNHLVSMKGGNYILKEYENMLVQSFLQPVLSARFEADRFVCLVKRENLHLESLKDLCDLQITYSDRTLRIMGRIGIYLVEDNKRPVYEMYDNARLAMHHILDEFVKPYEIFDSSMREKFLSRNEILNVFQKALTNGEFEVYYQPVYQVSTGKPVSAEALVRWRYEEGKVVGPGVFIPVLEENGQISQLDFHIIQSVARFQRQREEQGKYQIPVSINLSWMDFYDESMMEWILTDLKENPVPENMVRYELTETSYAAVVDDKRHILDNLKEVGAAIMLDDFGSGYSSFSMLQNYDFDIIKLDMGFVRKIETSEKTRKIIRAMIAMSHSIGATVIAEGAETKQQVDFLSQCGCDYIQGYYYSKPIPQREFEKLLDDL